MFVDVEVWLQAYGSRSRHRGACFRSGPPVDRWQQRILVAEACLNGDAPITPPLPDHKATNASP
jgi:hypothetical protein